MLVCALLLTISIAWALYDEAFGQRPWKGIQREFVSRYTRYLDSIKAQAGKSEAEIKESPEYQTARRRSESRARSRSSRKTTRSTLKLSVIQKKLDAVTDPFQNQRGRSPSSTTTSKQPKDPRKNDIATRRKQSARKWSKSNCRRRWQRRRRRRFNYAQLEKFYDDLREEKASYLGEKAELLKEAVRVSEETRRLS